MYSYTRSRADLYVSENSMNVNEMYRHKFHYMPIVGWMNDPNGFSFYKDEFHLFYQFHPYDSKPGPMHWGHTKSRNGIKWEEMPVALAPCDSQDFRGCFSGSAIEHNGKHVLFYTGVTVTDLESSDWEDFRQRQCLAIGDGEEYVKHLTPIFTESELPDWLTKQDFRDPKVFVNDDKFYCITGSRTKDGQGCLIIHEGEDLFSWKYKNILYISEEKNFGVLECPDYFKIDDTSIIICSPQNKTPVKNSYFGSSTTVYMLGMMDLELGKFAESFIDEIDYGFDFYAPQTMLDKKNRRIMIAWMQMWGRSMPSNEKQHNWAGAMTIPRELTLKDGRLFQYPIEEFNEYRDKELLIEESINGVYENHLLNGKFIDMEIEFEYINAKNFGVKLFCGENEETIFSFSPENGTVTFDRTKSGITIKSDSEELSAKGIRNCDIDFSQAKVCARFVLDNTSVESFFNHGERAMTGNIYSKENSDKIIIFSDNEINIKINHYSLII